MSKRLKFFLSHLFLSIFIALIVLLLFGGRKIPELMKGLGKGVSNFKKGLKDVEDDIKEDIKSDAPEAKK